MRIPSRIRRVGLCGASLLAGVLFAPSALASTATATVAATDAMTVRVSGYLQVDFQRHDASLDELDDGSGLPLNQDLFLIRRTRLKAVAEWRHFGLVGEAHFGSQGSPVLGVRQLEAFAQLPGDRPGRPWVRAGVGVFRVPFGYEVYVENNVDRLFTERALFAQAFVPGEFDLGGRVEGFLGDALSWVIAVQNGEPLGDRAGPGLDPNAAKDIAGRVGLATAIIPDLFISGGISALFGRGFHPGTRPTKDTLVWRDSNEDGLVQQSELVAIRGAAATPSESFERWGLGADLQLMLRTDLLGESKLYGELVLAANLDRGVAPSDPVSLGRDQRARGWYVAFTQELGAYAIAGVRVDQYTPNVDELDVQGGETVLAQRAFTHYTFTAAARLNVWGLKTRLVGEYAHRDNGLGRDDAGRPTRLADDILRFRAEASF